MWWSQILTSSNLASFSLVDAVQTLLGRRLEVLPPSLIAQLAGLAPLSPPLSRDDGAATTGPSGKPARGPAKSKKGQPPAQGADEEDAAAAALRLARYASTRVEMVMQLLARLATIAETFELARATGLTLASVLYNAQMIRTWSLLLRRARASSLGGQHPSRCCDIDHLHGSMTHRVPPWSYALNAGICNSEKMYALVIAGRDGYIISGRVEAQQLVESPYLIHPVEEKTVCPLEFESAVKINTMPA